MRQMCWNSDDSVGNSQACRRHSTSWPELGSHEQSGWGHRTCSKWQREGSLHIHHGSHRRIHRGRRGHPEEPGSCADKQLAHSHQTKTEWTYGKVTGLAAVVAAAASAIQAQSRTVGLNVAQTLAIVALLG